MLGGRPRFPFRYADCSTFEGLDRATERTGGDLELAFGLVHGRDDVLALGSEERFGEAADPVALPIDGVGDHMELGSSGGRIGSGRTRHVANLFHAAADPSVACPCDSGP